MQEEGPSLAPIGAGQTLRSESLSRTQDANHEADAVYDGGVNANDEEVEVDLCWDSGERGVLCRRELFLGGKYPPDSLFISSYGCSG